MEKVETLITIYQNPKILLGMKKVRFGKGKYNGFGGKVKPGENLKECVTRETQEESGLKIKDLKKMGKILFSFESDEPDHLVHFFVATEFEGTPIETEEMKFEWFNINEIPYDKMWPDDIYWLPILLKGKKFNGKFKFNLQNEIKYHEIREVDEIN
jgi:8-oxo-dGTP diphosphatase / 2-hydroxy-dATP diphosphatase